MISNTIMHKQLKTKQKHQQLSKSIHHLIYLLSPLNDKQLYQWIQTHSYDLGISQLNKIYCNCYLYPEIQQDTQIDRPFLKTPYNLYNCNDIIAYRSPYSNKYYPNIQNGVFPSPLVRGLQQKGRKLFEQYSKMYYCDNYISNVFIQQNQNQLWFAFCLQKSKFQYYAEFKEEQCQGIWSSLNFAVITGEPKSSIKYVVTTYVIYEISCTEDSQDCKPFRIKGNIMKKKQDIRKIPPQTQIDEFHLNSLGRVIQSNETQLRRKIQSIFAIKTNSIIQKTRCTQKRQQYQQILKQIKCKIKQKKIKGMLQLHN